MEIYGTKAQIDRTGADFVEAKDNYLLDFSRSVEAAFLVTGDQNLLALEKYFGTKIIYFREFVKVLEEQ